MIPEKDGVPRVTEELSIKEILEEFLGKVGPTRLCGCQEGVLGPVIPHTESDLEGLSTTGRLEAIFLLIELRT